MTGRKMNEMLIVDKDADYRERNEHEYVQDSIDKAH